MYKAEGVLHDLGDLLCTGDHRTHLQELRLTSHIEALKMVGEFMVLSPAPEMLVKS
jgi:hypothetical protein